MRNPLRLLGIVSVIACLLGGELSARPRTFVAGQGVRMKVEVPAGYSFKTEARENNGVIVQMENPVWGISVTGVIIAEYEPKCDTEQWQRDFVVSRSADFLAQSKEQDYKFLPLAPTEGTGLYCIFTDPEAKRAEELKPGEYLHAVTGVKVFRGAVILFRIMCNDVRSAEFQEVLAVFVNTFDPA